ncbi:MAG TPA: AI-2E family transporter [Methylocystis sp.]|jgi:predicted PurR-regulated permease PerM
MRSRERRAVEDSDSERLDSTAIVVAIGILGFVFHVLQWVLLPFVLAGLLAYLCNPLVEKLSPASRGSRLRGAVLVFIALAAIASLIGWLGLPPLTREIEYLVTDIQSAFRTVAHSLVDDRSVMVFGERMNADQLAQGATAGVRDWITQTGRLTELATLTFAAFFGGVLVLVLLFYMLLKGPEVFRGLLWLAPMEQRPTIEIIWSRLGPLLWRYILGVLIVVAYAIVAAYIGLGLLLGLRHAVFLAFLTGILEMIPVVGPGASAVIAGLVAIRGATGIGPVIGYAIYAIVLRLSIDQLLGPIILGAAATLSPILIIFSFLVGGVLFGVSGIILAVPAVITVKTSLAVLRDEPSIDASS